MKRVFCAVLVAALLLTFCACGKSTSAEGNDVSLDEHHAMLLKARNVLINAWEEIYKDSRTESDGYFQIKNTRLITFKKNTNKYFSDVAYIVEFVVFSDYYGSAPYYANAGFMDSVVVYRNGTMEANQNNLLKMYSSKTFSYDYSEFLEQIKDYADAYNIEKNLK